MFYTLILNIYHDVAHNVLVVEFHFFLEFSQGIEDQVSISVQQLIFVNTPYISGESFPSMFLFILASLFLPLSAIGADLLDNLRFITIGLLTSLSKRCFRTDLLVIIGLYILIAQGLVLKEVDCIRNGAGIIIVSLDEVILQFLF